MSTSGSGEKGDQSYHYSYDKDDLLKRDIERANYHNEVREQIEKVTQNKVNHPPFEIDGVVYHTFTEAHFKTGIQPARIKRTIKEGKREITVIIKKKLTFKVRPDLVKIDEITGK